MIRGGHRRQHLLIYARMAGTRRPRGRLRSIIPPKQWAIERFSGYVWEDGLVTNIHCGAEVLREKAAWLRSSGVSKRTWRYNRFEVIKKLKRRTVNHETTMRLLQLHEYLELLDGGTEAYQGGDTFFRVYLEQARAAWPVLQISSWEDRHRAIEYVAICRANGEKLVHISADWKDCFLILVVPQHQSHAEAYILFDIGAEYREARLICPAFEIDQVATQKMIRETIPRLKGETDPFAILQTGDGTYFQAYEDCGMFDVEYQLVSLSSHYLLERQVDAETVLDLFLSYAFGKKEWARDYKWNKMEL